MSASPRITPTSRGRSRTGWGLMAAVTALGLMLAGLVAAPGAAAATAPAITTQPADATVVNGTSVTLTAAASGSPAPTVQWWTRAAQSLSPARIPGATSPSYTTTNLNFSSQGRKFWAVFSNSAGSATTRQSTITVIDPVLPGAPVVQTISAGVGQVTIGFSAGSAGNPPATFVVDAVPTATQPSGIPTPATKSSGTLTTQRQAVLTGLTNGARYYARVRATNAAGTATSAGQPGFQVGSVPSFTGTPPNTTILATYSFQFQAQGSPAPTFRLMSGALPPGLSLSSAGRISGTVTGQGTFTFRVAAQNALATASSPFTITVS